MQKVQRTSQKQFREFKNEIVRLARLWGFTGWRLEFELMELKDGVFGNTASNLDQRSIVFRLNKSPGHPMPEISELARHELIHAMLEPLSWYAWDRAATEQSLQSAEHEVLNRLMVLLPK